MEYNNQVLLFSLWVQSGIAQLPSFSYWATQIGNTGPQQWQPPQNPQFAAGVAQYCGVWLGGSKGEVKRGGGGNGGASGQGAWGGGGGVLAPVCEFLSVKMGEPLDEIPSLGQYSFSFTTSMFFSFLITFSFSFLIFKAGEADSSCNSSLC